MIARADTQLVSQMNHACEIAKNILQKLYETN